MLDLLRSHPTALSLGVVGWLTWQALSGGPGKAKAGEEGVLPVVRPEMVATRPREAPLVTVRNPFPALAIDDLFVRPEVPEEVGGADGEEKPPEPVVVIERRPAFELVLDALFAFGPGGGHARINGRDVHPGEPIPGCDPESPPVLLDLGGLSARVEHRGQQYDLHLDLRPRLSLGGETIRHELPPDQVDALPPGAESVPVGDAPPGEDSDGSDDAEGDAP